MINTGFIIKNLCKKYKIEDDEHIVFSDISLEIQGDKKTVILGESGCGKTTFVMIQGVIGAFCVRIPVSYLMSKIEPVSLFKVGLATPASTLVQIILCVSFFVFLSKKSPKEDDPIDTYQEIQAL